MTVWQESIITTGRSEGQNVKACDAGPGPPAAPEGVTIQQRGQPRVVVLQLFAGPVEFAFLEFGGWGNSLVPASRSVFVGRLFQACDEGGAWRACQHAVGR